MKVINIYIVKCLHGGYCSLYECEKDLWYIDVCYYQAEISAYSSPYRQPIQTDEAQYILDSNKS